MTIVTHQKSTKSNPPVVRFVDESKTLNSQARYNHLPYDWKHLVTICKNFSNQSHIAIPGLEQVLNSEAQLDSVSELATQLAHLANQCHQDNHKLILKGLSDLCLSHLINESRYELYQQTENDLHTKYHTAGDGSIIEAGGGISVNLPGASLSASASRGTLTRISDTNAYVSCDLKSSAIGLGLGLKQVWNNNHTATHGSWNNTGWCGFRRPARYIANDQINHYAKTRFPLLFKNQSATQVEKRAILQDESLRKALEDLNIEGGHKTFEFLRYDRPFFFKINYRHENLKSAITAPPIAQAELGAQGRYAHGETYFYNNLTDSLGDKSGFLYLHDPKVKQVLKTGLWKDFKIDKSDRVFKTAGDVDAFIDSLYMDNVYDHAFKTQLRAVEQDRLVNKLAPHIASYRELINLKGQAEKDLESSFWLFRPFYWPQVSRLRGLTQSIDKELSPLERGDKSAISQASELRHQLGSAIEQQADDMLNFYTELNQLHQLESQYGKWHLRFKRKHLAYKEYYQLKKQLDTKLKEAGASNPGEFIRFQAVRHMKMVKQWERTFLAGSMSSTKGELQQKQQEFAEQKSFDKVTESTVPRTLEEEHQLQVRLASNLANRKTIMAGSLEMSDNEKLFQESISSFNEIYNHPGIALSTKEIEKYMFVKSIKKIYFSALTFSGSLGFAEGILGGKAKVSIDFIREPKSDIADYEGHFLKLHINLSGQVADLGISALTESVQVAINKFSRKYGISDQNRASIEGIIRDKIKHRVQSRTIGTLAGSHLYWEFRVMNPPKNKVTSRPAKLELLQFRLEKQLGVSVNPSIPAGPLSFTGNYTDRSSTVEESLVEVGTGTLFQILRKMHGPQFGDEYIQSWPKYAAKNTNALKSLFRNMHDRSTIAHEDYIQMLEDLDNYLKSAGETPWAAKIPATKARFAEALEEFCQEDTAESYDKVFQAFTALGYDHFNTHFIRQAKSEYFPSIANMS